MTLIERLLRRFVPFKDIGWTDIGERFTRFFLFRSKWFNVYLHQLYAPTWHPDCHDHPWSFLAVLLKGGYVERLNGRDHSRRPGSILWRPAETSHNVITPNGTSWSVIFTGPKKREWGFQQCAL